MNPFDQFTTKHFTPGGNPNPSPVASLSHLFSPMGQAGAAALGGVKSLVSSHVSASQTPADPRVAETLAGIAYNETRGVKGDPYGFSQPSGNPKYGNALGKYQVTEHLLKTLGPKYLGAPVSPKEFLSTPAIQESFMAARVKNLLAQDYQPEQIADIHRNGSTGAPGATNYQRPVYVQGFQQGRAQYKNQSLPPAQTTSR